MAIYEDLCFLDVLGPVSSYDFGTHNSLKLDDKGEIKLENIRAPGTPWINIKANLDRQCGKWTFIFKHYDIIPKGCRHCWKVVWTGETLDQLWRMHKVQEQMDMVCKSGIETRPYTGKVRLYQAFWYTPLSEGLKGARILWKKVVDTLAKDSLLAGCDVILKRGCTEMEQRYSPSDTWEKFALMQHWDTRELNYNEVYPDPEICIKPESTIMRIHVKRKWLEWAWEHKDPCATSKYPNKYFEAPLVPPAMRYDKSIHSEKDYNGYEDISPLVNSGGAKQIITDF